MPRVLLATIGGPHGVRGEVRVKAFTADPTAVGTYGPLASADDRSFEVERMRPAGNMLVVKFAGIDDRSAAEALNGVELFVERSVLPPAEPEEFYQADLIGLDAMSPAGERLGTVVAVQNFGAGDILEIAPERGPTLLVPFSKNAVPSVDIDAKRLVVIPPAESEEPADTDSKEE